MVKVSKIPNCFHRISIKALILDEKGRFLLCREKDDHWNFPGGGYDHSDKSPREALMREIKEEMNIEVVSIEDQPSYVTTAQHKKGFFNVNILYKTKLKNLDFTPSKECQEVRFFTVKEAFKMDISTNVQLFCEQYKI